MKTIILNLLFVTFSSACFAQARTPDIKIKKSTELVKHDTYTAIWAANYRNLESSYAPKLFEQGCLFKAYITVIKEPRLFKKGEHKGTFEVSCYNPKIKDINLFFAVYPYDEESDSMLEIIYKNGKSTRLYDCWNHDDGSSKDCTHLRNLGPSDYNFK